MRPSRSRPLQWFLLCLLSSYIVSSNGCSYQRLFQARCDVLAGQDTEDVTNRLPGVFIGQDTYDSANEVFVTEIGLDGSTSVPRDTFCTEIASGEGVPDCLGIRAQLPDPVPPAFRTSITANCSRSSKPSDPLTAEVQLNTQLAETLRAYNRAVLYNAKLLSSNQTTREHTYEFMMPLVTQDTNKATQYANESLLYFFYVDGRELSCVRKWEIATEKTTVRGIFKITFTFADDSSCTNAAVCPTGWKPSGQEAVACEEGVCYTRGRCMPDTCPVGRFGSACETCPAGQYSLKAGKIAKKKQACDEIPAGNTACKKIIDIKTGECSAGMSTDHKKKLSLVLNVDCLENGGVKLRWGEGIEEVEAKQIQLKDFLSVILNVSASDIVLELQRREVVFDGGSRRRLLQEATTVTDESNTDVTVSIQNGTTASASTKPSSSDESSLNAVPIVIAAIGALVLIGCLLVTMQSSRSGDGGVSRMTKVQSYVPLSYQVP